MIFLAMLAMLPYYIMKVAKVAKVAKMFNMAKASTPLLLHIPGRQAPIPPIALLLGHNLETVFCPPSGTP